MKRLNPGLVLLPVLALAGCGAGSSASRPVATPEWQAEGQAKCKVRASRAEPLVVEWPSADRAKLEALTHQGLVAVKYNGCEMQVMGACSAKGTYRYVGTTLKHDAVKIKDADELYAKLPFGAAGLESTLQRSGELDVSMTFAGRYAAAQPVIHESELTGSCAGATHVISALIVGAFEFSAKGARSEKERGSVFAGEAGSSGQAEKQVLTKDGDEASCAAAKDGDANPPPGCRALIRVEVLSLPEADRRAADAAEAVKLEAEARRASSSTRRTAGWALAGAGVGAAALAGFFAIRSNGKVSDIQNGGLATSRDIEDASSSSSSLATSAWIAGGIGAGLLAAGAVLVLTGRDATESGVQATTQGLRVAW